MLEADFYEIADGVEQEIGIDMYLDIIFSDELNHYFNYKYNCVEDTITLNFEVDKGSASIDIINAQSPCYSYRMNDVLTAHIETEQ